MGYFDALSNSSFKRTADRKWAFYPRGAVGRGYIIPDEQHYIKFRRFVKGYLIVGLSTIIALVALMPPYAFVAAAVLVASYYLWVPSLTKGLPVTEERLTIKESLQNQAIAHSSLHLWVGTLFSILFVVGGVLVLATDQTSWLVGVLAIVFFGLCAMFYIQMLTFKRARSLLSKAGPPNNP